ncbi:MAG: O-antigen ligase family protein [Chthoniobacterales bacterium]
MPLKLHRRVPEEKIPEIPGRLEAAGYILFLTLLLFLLGTGGGEHHWVQTVFVVGVTGLYAISPPRRLPGRLFTLCFLLLAVAPLLSFLPPNFLSGAQEWRKEWEGMGAGPLSACITPQPWVTLDCLPLFYGGLGLLWWILGQNPGNGQRRKLAIVFALCGSALVVVSLAMWAKHWHFPLWSTDGAIGPFQSRNQMATLLSVLSILFVALIHSDWRHGQRRWLFWVAALCVTLVTIVLNYSRAGILLFGFGIILYGALAALYRRRIALFSFSLTMLFIFTAFFFAGGGKTLARFLGPKARSFDLTGDFRFLVHKDAWSMITDNLLFGTGLGNFNAIFPVYRTTLWDYRTWHPESDWLWLGADLGLPAMLVGLLIAIGIAVRLFRVRETQISAVRIAGMVMCAQFLLHSYFDVSGHVPGTFALLCFSLFLCWPGPRMHMRGRWLANTILVLLAGMSLLWIAGLASPVYRIGAFQTATLMQQVRALREKGKFAEAEPLLDQAKIQTPLDQWVHYLSARNLLARGGDRKIAHREFELAARLEPFSPVTEEDAARDWLKHDPAQAPAPFIRALERSYPRQLRMGRYELYLIETQPFPGAYDTLLQYGWHDTDLVIVRLKFVPQSDMLPELKVFMERYNKNLDTLTAPRFFQTVESRSGIEGLEAVKGAAGAKLVLARAYAKEGDFRQAYLLGLQNQTVNFGRSIGNKESLYRDWKKDPSNYIKGIALLPLLSVPRDTSIINELMQAFGKRPDVPPSLYLLAAYAAADNREWEGAWRYLEVYLKRKP